MMFSKSLQQKTKETLENISESALKDLSAIQMKNYEDYFGFILKKDLEKGIIRIIDHDDYSRYNFNSIDELIEAGWVLD